MREKYQEKIKNRIDAFEDGYVFTASDFADIADMDPANKALSRLSEGHRIRRIMKGVYDKPVYSNLLQESAAPRLDAIAAALARKFNWTIAPHGETALNYLNLSTQVSNHCSYISDGPYREYQVGPYTLEFRHCANKEVSGRNPLTLVIMQALKRIGKDNIQEQDIRRISNALNDEEKRLVSEEARSAPSWIYKTIKEICLS